MVDGELWRACVMGAGGTGGAGGAGCAGCDGVKVTARDVRVGMGRGGGETERREAPVEAMARVAAGVNA